MKRRNLTFRRLKKLRKRLKKELGIGYNSYESDSGNIPMHTLDEISTLNEMLSIAIHKNNRRDN